MGRNPGLPGRGVPGNGAACQSHSLGRGSVRPCSPAEERKRALHTAEEARPTNSVLTLSTGLLGAECILRSSWQQLLENIRDELLIMLQNPTQMAPP